jgi:hypothetical protein
MLLVWLLHRLRRERLLLGLLLVSPCQMFRARLLWPLALVWRWLVLWQWRHAGLLRLLSDVLRLLLGPWCVRPA